jgi:hypothetical protein
VTLVWVSSSLRPAFAMVGSVETSSSVGDALELDQGSSSGTGAASKLNFLTCASVKCQKLYGR